MGQPVTHFQLLARDPDRIGEFYVKLFGWKIRRDNPLDYRMIETGAAVGGGIWPCPPEGKPMVQLFIAVPDVTAAVANAQKLGANVVIPPQKLPDGDEMAVLLDPEGVPFGVTKQR